MSAHKINDIKQKQSTEIAVILQEIREKVSILDTQESFHPSECMNMNPDTRISEMKFEGKKWKYFEKINKYHIYCKICQQHFYSYSKWNDINSFFQPHLNSEDHLWNKKKLTYSHSKPIFKWNKWLFTGFCEICKKSDVEAFIIDTKLTLKEIARMHCKGFKHLDKVALEGSKTTSRVLPSVSIFADICIEKITSREYICKLCCTKIVGVKALIEYHLNSKNHYERFKKFLKLQFNISAGELLISKRLIKLIRLTLNGDFKIENPAKVVKTENEDDYLTRIDYETEENLINHEGFSPKELGFSPQKMEYLLTLKKLLQDKEDPADKTHKTVSNSYKMREMIFLRCTWALEEWNSGYTDSQALNKFKTEMKKYERFKTFFAKLKLHVGMSMENKCQKIKFSTNSWRNQINDRKEITKKSNRGDVNPKEVVDIVVAKVRNSKMTGPKSSTTEFRAVKVFNVNNFEKALVDCYTCPVVISKEGYCCTCNSHVPKDVGAHSLTREHQKHEKFLLELLTVCKDGFFQSLIELWIISSRRSLVCTACCIPIYFGDLFFHLTSKGHVHKWRETKPGHKTLVSLDGYSIHPENKEISCNRCKLPVFTFKSINTFNFLNFVKALKMHDNCLKGVEESKKSPIEQTRKKFKNGPNKTRKQGKMSVSHPSRDSAEAKFGFAKEDASSQSKRKTKTTVDVKPVNIKNIQDAHAVKSKEKIPDEKKPSSEGKVKISDRMLSESVLKKSLKGLKNSSKTAETFLYASVFQESCDLSVTGVMNAEDKGSCKKYPRFCVTRNLRTHLVWHHYPDCVKRTRSKGNWGREYRNSSLMKRSPLRAMKSGFHTRISNAIDSVTPSHKTSKSGLTANEVASNFW